MHIRRRMSIVVPLLFIRFSQTGPRQVINPIRYNRRNPSQPNLSSSCNHMILHTSYDSAYIMQFRPHHTFPPASYNSAYIIHFSLHHTFPQEPSKNLTRTKGRCAAQKPFSIRITESLSACRLSCRDTLCRAHTRCTLFVTAFPSENKRNTPMPKMSTSKSILDDYTVRLLGIL